ncbi:hypothetical protein P389DRAFT_92520 [Cystobasidium minutum MCA 4210]|uniref:uncharacterized protein n=1 Tax=Cystobasidium minutum MCA 4210 TaxID=1397322 RepID=UPI0034CD96A5|eukprot:jgi/Rhomi1/92520/CE92519_204
MTSGTFVSLVFGIELQQQNDQPEADGGLTDEACRAKAGAAESLIDLIAGLVEVAKVRTIGFASTPERAQLLRVGTKAFDTLEVMAAVVKSVGSQAESTCSLPDHVVPLPHFFALWAFFP